ncbi:SDR family NAD(P)-dependent oxidoreductase [Neptunomonas sp.]|uniref:SDR family NAD(P)-dependent oxidoreductase n=1 Tax=Neptunomonas sp. TaxID=1971898 RepID=UPI003565FAC9
MEKRIAIIGTSFRFPGSPDNTLWKNLLDNKDLVTHVEDGRWSFDAYQHPDKKHPGTSYTFAAGSIGDVSGFDAGFFGISPREAALIDPQQRILLELAWEAIESTGRAPSSLRGSDCGVFIGISGSDYAFRFAEDLTIGDSSISTGNTSSIAANRISYQFDLHGPSLAIDTACSSSMVAFHQACQAIRTGEIQQALTGGICLHLHPYGFIAFAKATMLSPKGRCQVFDEAGDGYVRSEGGGLFFIKDYDAAIRDGDTVLAIVAGSAVNTDGYKSGLTLPNPDAQASLLEATYRKAGVSADQIDYLEAHGTGTAVGDPIETRAISNALGIHRSTPLPIGSVKSNVGHMETASGVAGLAKALYSLQHRMVPATISMKNPNPNIHFDEWNIRVVTQNMPLPQTGTLTIGVNSFGFGGANAHVILQTPPPLAVSKPDESLLENTHSLPLIISGRDTQALHSSVKQTISLLKSTDTTFYDLAYHYFFRKERHPIAHAIWADSKETALGELQSLLTEETPAIHLDKPKSDIAFVYSGNGCQWETMGRTLLDSSVVFRDTIKTIDAIFEPLAGFSLQDELAGKNGSNRFSQTEIAQPALFALQVGLTEIFRARHILPKVVTGHSVGEVAAAWACGALTLTDAIHVIYYRSKYQGLTAGRGQMTAVGLDADTTLALINEHKLERIELAGINSYRGVTVAGDPEQLSLLEAALKTQGAFVRRLPLNYAFHSSAMDSIESQVTDSLASIQAGNSTLPFFSTVTGAELSGTELKARYWWDNIRKPVQFQPAIDALISQGITTFIEIAAHPVLKSYLNDELKNTGHEGLVLATVTKNNDSLKNIERTLANVILAASPNQATEIAQLFPVTGTPVSLPAYPWQRERFWHKTTAEASGMLTRELQHPLLGFPVKQIDNTWENTLDTGAHPWLADHAVGDNIVFPGAGFAEILFAAIDLTTSKSNTPKTVIELEEFEIKTPLLLDDNSCKKIRTTLNPETGQVTIKSREYVTGESWTPNASGRYLKAPTELHLSEQAPALPDSDADFTLATHLELNKAAGLNYGPAFQTISHGWVSPSEVLAVFVPQQHPEYTLHPGQLDCAFQLIIHFLKDQLATHQGIAYVPTKIGRIFVRSGEYKLHTAKACLLKRSPHSITASFSLFDENGLQIAALDEARFRAVRVNKTAAQRVDFIDYQLTAVPDRASNPVIKADITTLFSKTLSEASSAKSQQYMQEIEPLFEALSSAFVYETLIKLEKENNLTSAYKEQLGLSHPEAAHLFAYIIHYALERDMITATDNAWQVIAQNDEDIIPSDVIWQMMARDYPDYFFITQTLGRFGLHLESILSAQQTTEQLGFGIETYSQLLAARHNSLITHHISEQLSSLIEAQTNQHPGQRIRILEAAIDAPEFARQLCSKLDFTRNDYTFCSLSQDAIEKAEHLQEDYPLLNTQQLLDLEANTCLQHQIVIINLNGACQNNLGIFMRHLDMMMADNALVLLIAPTPADWIDVLMSGNANWWPEQNRPQHSATEWAEIFSEFGLQNLQIIESYNDTPVSVMAGQAPSKAKTTTTAAAQSWLIMHDEATPEWLNSTEAHFAEEKISAQRYSSSTSSLLTTDESELQSLWDEKQHDNILFLSGLQQQSCFEELTARCKALNKLFNAAERSSNPVTLWVVTYGVANTYLCDDPNAQFDEHITADDAALWGFARTLMNEATHVEIRLVDIAPLAMSEAILKTLQTELLSPSVEAELFIDQQGRRYAPRLRKGKLISEDDNRSADTTKNDFYLGFELPGQLKNLHWFTKPTPQLSAADIRVDVKATGLNFRDIMYTLGLLSDEAIENGFAGPTLGFEFAGIVTEVGNDVQDYAVGDLVVGFGPASFSNSVITQSSAIANIPQGISFEAAATIPSTFFTVYYAMHHLARIEPGEKVLIHGAAGGVGIAAIQIAQWLGAEIYATVGSDSKRDFLRMMGVKHIYDSRSLTFAEEILLVTEERGVDVVLNSLAGEAINQNFRVLKPFGRFLELGKRDFYENTHIGLRPFRNNISYFGIDADQLMQEKPVLTHRLFQEMMQLFKDGTLFPLPYTRFDANQIVDAFRFMQQAKQIGKIVVSYEQEVLSKTLNKTKPNKQQLSLSGQSSSNQASYLVTGGLGGFGLKTAQWLVSRGATHLILISRSGPRSDEAKQALAAFKEQGVTVMAQACDVSDRDALSSLLALASQQMPPIKGVVHAAAVIEDSIASNLSAEQIDRVLTPKIAGAKWLDELTDELDLEFFVLYSSATTLLGNPGQSSYVAANHWLEALTANRRKRGKVATCPRWGAIDDVGFLARNEKIKDALQSRIGGHALASDLALESLEQMILNDVGNMGVLEFDWAPLKRFLPSSDQAKFREIALSSHDSDHEDDNRLEITELLAMSDAELTDTILDLLRSKLSQILMISEEKLDINRSMYDMGLDSLMGVELMSAIESLLGVTISVMALSETPTLSKLSERLVAQLRGEHQESDDMTKHITSQHTAKEDLPA